MNLSITSNGYEGGVHMKSSPRKLTENGTHYRQHSVNAPNAKTTTLVNGGHSNFNGQTNNYQTITKSNTITHGISAVSQKIMNSSPRKTSLISTSRSSTPSKANAQVSTNNGINK